MSTDTVLRDPRAYPTRGGILADFPQWAYLALVPDTTRPATEAEAARYAARQADPEWEWLYDLASRPPPSAPRISAPLTLTVAGDTQPVPAPEAPAAPALEPLPGLGDLDKKREEALGRFNEAHDAQPADDDEAASEPAQQATSVMPVADTLAEAVAPATAEEGSR